MEYINNGCSFLVKVEQKECSDFEEILDIISIEEEIKDLRSLIRHKELLDILNSVPLYFVFTYNVNNKKLQIEIKTHNKLEDEEIAYPLIYPSYFKLLFYLTQIINQLNG